MDYQSLNPKIDFGILEIDQVRIALPNVSQAKADYLSKELNIEIRRIVEAFVRALN